MGKSIRSKRMRANRQRKRQVNRPKELKKLEEALKFAYNEETENAHLSMFHDIVNAPIPHDGTYFEPSKTVLEKTQERYESFLSRKIPKIVEIASKNLQRPIVSQDEEKKSDIYRNEDKKTNSSKVPSDVPVVSGKSECKPNKSGSWPKWMSQRKIKEIAKTRRKIIKRTIKKERRMNRGKNVQRKK